MAGPDADVRHFSHPNKEPVSSSHLPGLNRWRHQSPRRPNGTILNCRILNQECPMTKGGEPRLAAHRVHLNIAQATRPLHIFIPQFLVRQFSVFCQTNASALTTHGRCGSFSAGRTVPDAARGGKTAVTICRRPFAQLAAGGPTERSHRSRVAFDDSIAMMRCSPDPAGPLSC